MRLLRRAMLIRGTNAPANSSQRPATNHDRRAPDTNFSPISVSIPTDSLLEDDFLTNVSFSKRGSLMFGGKRAFPPENMATESRQLAAGPTNKAPRAFPLVTKKTQPDDDRGDAVEPPPAAADDASADDATEVAPAKPRSTPSVRVLSADVERESQKVRSLYEVGDAINWEQGAPGPASAGERLSSTPEGPVDEGKHDTYDFHGSRHRCFGFGFQLLTPFFSSLWLQTRARQLSRSSSGTEASHFRFHRLFAPTARLSETRV